MLPQDALRRQDITSPAACPTARSIPSLCPASPARRTRDDDGHSGALPRDPLVMFVIHAFGLILASIAATSLVIAIKACFGLSL